jgi:hypothetical protein
MPEASPEFKQQLRMAFDSIEEGQIFTFQRTFTEGDVALFCGVTGDYNPASLTDVTCPLVHAHCHCWKPSFHATRQDNYHTLRNIS